MANFVWWLVGLPLGVWMVVGHSDVAALLFAASTVAHAVARHYLDRRPRPSR
jgi:hypothetical protein